MSYAIRREIIVGQFLVLLAAVLAGACAGSGGKTPGVASADRNRSRPASELAIARRDTPVPKVADADERLAFVRAGAIWIMSAGGETAEEITVRGTKGPDAEPNLSPDGKSMVYSSSRDGAERLYLLPFEDMIPIELSKGAEGGDRSPEFSPDGKRIAFMRGDANIRVDLYVLDLQTKTTTPILKGDDDFPQHTGQPAWSPDGTEIVISADRRQNEGTLLWLVNLSNRELRRATPPVPRSKWIRDMEPHFHPDGSRIAFASNRHTSAVDFAEDTDIYTIGSDGTDLMRLTTDSGVARQPAYSPAGDRIFFASTRLRVHGFEWEIYVMAAAGGEQKRMTRDERPENHSPSPGFASDVL